MMKKMIALLCISVCALALIAIPVAGATGIPNPVRDVTRDEMLEETYIWFDIPEGAQEVAYSIIDIVDGEAVSQVQFMFDGTRYCCRMQPGEALNDISGMYYEWTANETLPLNDMEVEVRYNEGGAGILLWYSPLMGFNCSVSMDTGATVDTLVAIASPIASWQSQEVEYERLAVDYEIEDETVLTVSLEAYPTTGYNWTFEISDEIMLDCEKVEFIPFHYVDGNEAPGGMYVAVFSPTFHPGSVTLTFRYVDGTEGGAPQETFVFNLWVYEAGTLSVEGIE